MLYRKISKWLFHLDPETAHYLALNSLKIAHQLGLTALFCKKILKPCTLFGLQFPNPIGLAAGLDKNGDYIDALSALGFGFIEVGTVTPKPQEGNPKPRLFRLIEQEALINRMGFNNKGLDYVVERLRQKKSTGIVGVNIGKNRDTPLENAVDDYLIGFKKVAPYASYVTINISSPNTMGLRDLQHGDFLQNLLRKLKEEQAKQTKYVPLIVKIAPDLEDAEIKKMAEIFLQEKIDGVIATNTTIKRDGVEQSPYANETGGLSGKPLRFLTTETVKKFHAILQDNIPIIACGGISESDDIQRNKAVGAVLFQIYTGLIYQGPGKVAAILSAAKNL